MGGEEYPRYHIPAAVLLDLAAAALTGQRRSFRAHARRMMQGIRPALVVIGAENIPNGGPGVITVNHYSRPGFWSPWFAAAVSAQLAVEPYWTMTDAFTYPGQPLGGVKRWFSHILLSAVARVYRFNRMPPMPPAAHEVAERAAAVQRLVRHVRANPAALICLAPEGGDALGGVLMLPPEGFGRLALLLAQCGMLFTPVGVYEQGGCLIIHFGKAYWLAVAQTSNRALADLAARRQVMHAIASLLPVRLRGEF